MNLPQRPPLQTPPSNDAANNPRYSVSLFTYICWFCHTVLWDRLNEDIPLQNLTQSMHKPKWAHSASRYGVVLLILGSKKTQHWQREKETDTETKKQIKNDRQNRREKKRKSKTKQRDAGAQFLGSGTKSHTLNRRAPQTGSIWEVRRQTSGPFWLWAGTQPSCLWVLGGISGQLHIISAPPSSISALPYVIRDPTSSEATKCSPGWSSHAASGWEREGRGSERGREGEGERGRRIIYETVFIINNARSDIPTLSPRRHAKGIGTTIRVTRW